MALIGQPFDVVATKDGRWSFVGLSNGQLAVLSLADAAPRLTKMLALPGRHALPGLALTHDGRYLLVADGASGVAVLDASLATRPESAAVLGRLSAPGLGDAAAVEVEISVDDRLAFVTLEKGDAVAVFDLGSARAEGFRGSGFLGFVPVGLAPVGMATSPDGRWLYVTSAIASSAAACGTLSVIDVKVAGQDPAKALVATVSAGCGPVRVAASPDGKMVWVTARESNALFAFSSSLLLSDPDHSIVAEVQVGQSPVGLAVLADGRQIAVADSNRYLAPGGTANVSLVDSKAALAGTPAVFATIRTGAFPRALALTPNGKTLLIADYGSANLQAVDLGP